MRGQPIAPAGPNNYQDTRRHRFEARSVLWGESSLRRVRACGRVVTSTTGGVGVRVTTHGDGSRRAGFAGLQRCGSFSACPVCSAVIAETRRLELERAVQWWTSQGGRVLMVTLTIRHRLGQPLAGLLDAVSGAWGAALQGSMWKRHERAHGVPLVRVVRRSSGPTLSAALRIPAVRVIETTHGRNGWHPHVHAALFVPAGMTEREASEVARGMFSRWRLAVMRAGFEAPTTQRGVTYKLLEDSAAGLADYFAKAVYRFTAEIASGMQSKTPKGGNRTPFMVLADVVRLGDASDLDLWHEWERASHGRRFIAWTLGFRQMIPDLEGEELTDLEIVEADQGGDTVAVLTGDEWKALLRSGRVLELLEAFEISDVAGRDWLAGFLAGLPPS